MSVQRTFAVIEHLARTGPLALRALARDLDLPVGSTHRLVADLADEGMVERTPHGEWQLTYKIVSIAGAQLAKAGLTTTARPALRRLAELSGQTAFLATRSGQDVVYLDKVQSDAQLQLYVEIGAHRPSHSTALGKAMLAHLSPDELDAIIVNPLPGLTEHTITGPEVLNEHLALVRVRGYATDKEEAVMGVSCIAAPIFDYSGGVVGAISVAGTDSRLYEEDPKLVGLIKRAASGVSQQLGQPAAPIPTAS